MIEKIVLIFIINLILYCLIGAYGLEKRGFVGDEPNYIIITKSLIFDHDFDLKNNYQEDYPESKSYHVSVNSLNNKSFSVHNIGLSILIAPGFLLIGKYGTILIINILAALASVIIFLIASKILQNKTKVFLIWLLSFTVPITLYSSAIFTEMPLFLISLSLLYLILLYKEKPKILYLIIFALLCSIFPWLHVKYILILIIYSLVMIFHINKKILVSLVIIIIPPIISILLELLLFKTWFGSFSLDAQYPGGLLTSTNNFSLINFIQGVTGLFYDKAFGIFLYTPIYLLSFSGLYFLYRLDKKLAISTLIIFLISIVSFGLYIKYLGFCPEGRFIIPALPIIIFWLIYTLKYLNNIYLYILYISILTLSLLMSCYLIIHPDYTLNIGFVSVVYQKLPIFIQNIYNTITPVLIGQIEQEEVLKMSSSDSARLVFLLVFTILLNYIYIYFGKKIKNTNYHQ